MHKRKILFAGCSMTAECGFSEQSRIKHHWPHLLSQKFDCYYNNIAIGGMSNEEIYYRTLETVLQQEFDLVVVMWSAIGRRWIYYNTNNVDDWTSINPHSLSGYCCQTTEVKDFSKINKAFFENSYMNIKHWLLLINSLQNIFVNSNQPYVFAKGFDNYLQEFKSANYTNNGFDLASNIMPLLDFDNRPDYYIYEKLSIIKNLISQVDCSNWANWDETSFQDSCVDLSEDNMHPGIKSNLNFLNLITNHIEQRQLL
jgi:hypothetical protein